MRLRATEVDGRPASYREAGAGPTAVIVPGLGLTGRFYDASFPAFAAAGVRLVVPDLPGWGRTPGPLTGVSPVRTAAFLAEFADAIELEQAVWIGHSVGAQAAVEVAIRRPALARGVVLVGPTGAAGRLELPRQLAALGIEGVRTSLHVLRGVARDYVRTPPPRYLGTWIRHSGHDLPARAVHVTCPALILTGDSDPVCRSRFIERLKHCLPEAAVEWVRGGTHALPRGHAAHFNRAVTSFVLQHAPQQ
jgi:2-hydroxy-6-oxonona-2,4-dienedioate hydrolase